MLRIVATTPGEAEAEIACARLADVGIRSFHKRNSGDDVPHYGPRGARDIYVDERDAQRARDLLRRTDEFSEQELAELATSAPGEVEGEPPAD